jgi:hypothetical protein
MSSGILTRFIYLFREGSGRRGGGLGQQIEDSGGEGGTVMRFALIQLNSASFFRFSTIPGNSYTQPLS